jgi:hypothetical protein
MTAPTRPAGYTDDVSFFNSIIAATDEHITDLWWPSSINIYSQMRTDPQLAAVLAACGLPIRRATWQVDGAGCKARATRLVADGLGLPVAERDDRPSGARVRGVTWAEVNRLALLDMVYGHFPFEEWYVIDPSASPATRLAGLLELMPATIAEVDTARDGSLKSITQVGAPKDNPPIPANHLLWFARDREGAAWQGRSILRPAYAAWVLKREMLRAHATGSRRFNHGVPTVVWDPGSDPTPAQLADAHAYASAARVGDQSGGSLPPGAHLELVGLTGGVPDTLSFIRYLDQQMSRMALAGMLDLGETPNGSRALGAEFVDLFLLALQAHADEHAAAVTRQTVARLVAYNWGEAEPVPQVVAADVGSKREVTVEALQLLLASGAVHSDPGLERWVRSEWRLPVVEEVPPMPTPPVLGGASAPPGGAAVPPPSGDASGG